MNAPRIYVPWWKWECYKAGFYTTIPPNKLTKEECLLSYKDFLSDTVTFQTAMELVEECWINSCLHFLTNPSMNRVAWLGQASMCISSGIPSTFKAGFSLLSTEQQHEANNLASKYLKGWHERNFEKCVSLQKEMAKSRVS